MPSITTLHKSVHTLSITILFSNCNCTYCIHHSSFSNMHKVELANFKHFTTTSFILACRWRVSSSWTCDFNCAHTHHGGRTTGWTQVCSWERWCPCLPVALPPTFPVRTPWTLQHHIAICMCLRQEWVKVCLGKVISHKHWPSMTSSLYHGCSTVQCRHLCGWCLILFSCIFWIFPHSSVPSLLGMWNPDKTQVHIYVYCNIPASVLPSEGTYTFVPEVTTIEG